MVSGEAVMACDMPEPWKFPSLDSCQKRFLWNHRQILFSLAIAAIDEAILMQTFTEQVPSFYRIALTYLKMVNSSNF